jgi:hypothetical protein
MLPQNSQFVLQVVMNAREKTGRLQLEATSDSLKAQREYMWI